MASYTEAPSGATATDGDKSIDARPTAPVDVTATSSTRLSPARPAGDATVRPDRGARPTSPRTSAVAPVVPDASVIIPAGFYLVECEVVDTDGNTLEDAKWIQSAGTFPTAAKVDDDGMAYLWLLGTAYDSFMCIVDDGEQAGLDYTWYWAADSQEPITPTTQDTGTIVINPERPATPLQAGSGVFFG